MNKLEELLKETDFTQEEWKIFRKVMKHNQLEDLQYLLDEMLENEEITQEQYNEAVEDAEWIVERFDNAKEDDDWLAVMEYAIRCVIGE